MDPASGLVHENQFALPHILCCLCGISVESNPSAMCLNCLKTQVDITEGISKQLSVHWCKNCTRYLRPPWQACQPESRELLSLLLSKVRGMSKECRLVDCDFEYTEPHSKRLKIKVTIQKEVFVGAILQQAFIVEFVVENMQCPDCAQSFTDHVWQSVVQVRQKVKHKRTFLFLEQLMLKHSVCKNILGVKEISGGLDFYWAKESQAMSMVHFLRGVVPMKLTESRKLISEDHTNNTQNFKYTYYVEIVPICRADLVYIPRKIGKKFGGVNEIMLCDKISSNIHLIDPTNLRHLEIGASVYHRAPFHTILLAAQMTLFDIMDVEIDRSQETHKHTMCEVTVARMSDYKQFTVSSHLGRVLDVGQTYLGYDLTSASIMVSGEVNTDAWPEVVLVKRHYNKKNRERDRTFKLKELEKTMAETKQRKNDTQNNERDREMFMQEIEEDPEFRSMINIYKREGKSGQNNNNMQDGEDSEEEEAPPEIAIDELLDEMAELRMDSTNPPDNPQLNNLNF